MRVCLLIGIFLSVANIAYAGEIIVATDSHDLLNQYTSVLDIKAPTLTVAPGPQTNTYNFEPAKTDTVYATVTVTVTNAPTGYDGFQQSFDIPYDQFAKNVNLATIVVNDDANDIATHALLKWAQSVDQAKVEDWISIHQRARHIFDVNRSGTPDGRPDPDDVRVCYWYLQSATELLQQFHTFYFRMDGDTMLAVAWMRTILKQYPTLFRADTVPSNVAAHLIYVLEKRDSFVYAQLIAKISNDIQNRATMDAGCARTKALESELERLDPNEVDPDGQTPNLLDNMTNIAICDARARSSDIAKGNITSEPQSKELSDDAIRLKDLLANAAQHVANAAQHANLNGWKEAIGTAQARLAELKAVTPSTN